MADLVPIRLTVNGEVQQAVVDPRQNLVDFLRVTLELTGSHVGCEHGVCGACTVEVDGVTVRGCLMFAVQADGAEVVTVEGLAASGRATALRAAFTDHNALQCGFCTPGMLAAAVEYIEQGGQADRAEIRAHLSGNYCRCTGYQSIVDAVESVIKAGQS